MALKVDDEIVPVSDGNILHSLSRALGRVVQWTQHKGALLHELHEVWLIEELLSSGGKIYSKLSKLHRMHLADAVAACHTFTIDDGVVDIVFALDSAEA